MLSEKTKMPLGFVVTLFTLLSGLIGAAAVAQFRISDTAQRQEKTDDRSRRTESKAQRIEDTLGHMLDTLKEIREDVKELKRDAR